MNNQEVKKFIEFYWEVIESEIKEKGKAANKFDYKSSVVPVAISAKHV
mgnify:CR=1 FL=1